MERINKAVRWIFEMNNKIDKILARLNKKKRAQITNTKNLISLWRL